MAQGREPARLCPRPRPMAARAPVGGPGRVRGAVLVAQSLRMITLADHTDSEAPSSLSRAGTRPLVLRPSRPRAHTARS
jgi:hypothetical protein